MEELALSLQFQKIIFRILSEFLCTFHHTEGRTGVIKLDDGPPVGDMLQLL